MKKRMMEDKNYIEDLNERTKGLLEALNGEA